MTILVDIDDELSETLRDLDLFLMRTLHEEEVEYFMSCLGSIMIYALVDDNVDTAFENLDAFIYDPGQEALTSLELDDLNKLHRVCVTIVDAWFIRYSRNPPLWLDHLTKGPGFITTYDVFYVEWRRGYRFAEIT